ncbi:hypothetical protein KRP22_008545 [Phytophthora ramorum]|nr:hypothetical protein KRP22_7378 [Phytophthora ramorum]
MDATIKMERSGVAPARAVAGRAAGDSTRTRRRCDCPAGARDMLQHHGQCSGLRFLGSGPTVNLLMELLPIGSLTKLLKGFGTMHEQTLRNIVRDVVCGAAHSYASGIAPRRQTRQPAVSSR